ncbi:MAG: hypothetical protein ACOYLX_19495 [Burkholderiaceae bacterium]
MDTSAWSRDVVGCTATELMFDWLRDRLAGADRNDLGALAERLHAPAGGPTSAPLLRGLCSAFLDEADGLLVDAATLPCILAQAGGDEADGCAAALRVAGALWQGRDYTLDAGARRAMLTEAGRDRVEAACASLDGGWRIARVRETRVAQALAALHLYRPDRDYLLRDGRVEIVDASTGRVAHGRAWSAGLHQMIEHKERAAGTLPHRPVIQVSPSDFFPRYWRLGGLSATLAEEGGELAAAYGAGVVRIAPRVPSQRTDLGVRVFADAAAQRAALIERARALTAAGRPVLVAVRDVAESTAIGDAMRAAGLAPATIDARHAEAETDTVAAAGHPGQVTIATDMAGRGTDVVLAPASIGAGGLALLATHLHASRRLQRQLHGRVARRGEPGSIETLLCIDDPVSGAIRGRTRLAPFVGRLRTGVASTVVGVLLRAVQVSDAARARRYRERLRAAARQRLRAHVIGRVED